MQLGNDPQLAAVPSRAASTLPAAPPVPQPPPVIALAPAESWVPPAVVPAGSPAQLAAALAADEGLAPLARELTMTFVKSATRLP